MSVRLFNLSYLAYFVPWRAWLWVPHRHWNPEIFYLPEILHNPEDVIWRINYDLCQLIYWFLKTWSLFTFVASCSLYNLSLSFQLTDSLAAFSVYVSLTYKTYKKWAVRKHWKDVSSCCWIVRFYILYQNEIHTLIISEKQIILEHKVLMTSYSSETLWHNSQAKVKFHFSLQMYALKFMAERYLH